MIHKYAKPTRKWFRLVLSKFPPINVFEDCYDSPEEFEAAFAIEAMTNDRLRHEAGNLHIVPKEDWITGIGSTPIMASFTHLGNASRFTNGQVYGVYYAADDIETAIKETMYHNAHFLSATKEGDTELTMRSYVTTVKKPLVDVTADDFNHLHDKTNYQPAQAFADALRQQNEWGLLYNSVRNQGHKNIAILRPPALTHCQQGGHYRYQWSGIKQAFTGYFEISNIKIIHQDK